jgi:hypothetical protein
MKVTINERGEMRFILLASLLILSVSLISAAGVASPYWDDRPLKLAAGESKTVTLALQNMVGTEDMYLEAEISADPGVTATLVDGTEYFVPLGRDDVPLNVKVDVPEDVVIGGTSFVYVSLQQVAGGEGGMIRVAGGFTSKFPVEVVGFEESELRQAEPEKEFSPLWIGLGVLVVLLLLGLIRKAKNIK